MLRPLLFSFAILVAQISVGQCPQVFDFEGNSTSSPYWYDCNGGTYEFSLQSPNNWNDITINWGDGTSISTLNNWTAGTPINHTYAAAVDTFVVTITNTTGCLITGVVVMEQAASASIQIPVGGVTQGCAPQLMSFVNSSTNVSQTTVFHWDFGDNTADLTFDASNLNAVINHTYQPGSVSCETIVTLTAENYCNAIQGGESVATFNPIRVWDTDLPNITVPNTTLCFPETTFNFTNNGIKNCFTQGNIFQRQEKWIFGDYWGTGIQETGWIPFPPNLPQSVTFPGLGDYTVTVLDSNYCGIEEDQITVHIVNPPTASFTVSQDTVCVGQNIQFTPSATGANQHFWNFTGNWTPADGGVMNFSFNTPGTYTVSYRAVQSLSPTSCADTASRTIVVLAAPTTQITTPLTSACDSLHVTLSQSSTGNPVQYSWTLLNGLTFSGINPPAFDITTAGNYTISLQVTASNGCSATDSQLLQVISTPSAQFTSSGVCQGSSIQFINTSGGANIPSQWNFGDGTSSNASSPSHVFPTAGTFGVQLIAGITGCQDTIVDSIFIAPLPTINFSASETAGCTPLGVVFSNNSSGVVSQTWTFGDNSSSNLNSPSHIFSTTLGNISQYTVTLNGISTEGCSASASQTITVSSGASAAFTDANNIPECSPHNSAFINNSQSATQYLWDFGDGNTSSAVSPNHTYENNTNVVQFYNVSLIAYSPGGCNDTTAQTVVVFPAANFNLDLTTYSGCSPVHVSMPLIPGVASYSWDFGDGATSTAALPSHTFETAALADTFLVSFSGTTVFGCLGAASTEIIVLGSPHSDFLMDENSSCEPAEIVFNNNSSQAESYQWNFNDGSTSNTNDSIFNHTFTAIGDFVTQYTIELISIGSNGCSDTSSAPFTLYPQSIAQFNPSLTEGCAPFNCLFQNTSTGATLFNWQLGDGNNSNSISPSHTYQNLITQDSTYQVTLVANNAFGCADTQSTFIQVHRTPVAYFDMIDTTGCYPMTITFDNGSVGADSYSWNYGTGETSINGEDIHQHNFFNLTNVAVTNAVVLAAITSEGCYSTYTMPVTTPPGITANFTGDFEGCHPFSTLFLNQSIGAQSYAWDFGDGTVSNAFNPSHIFSNPNQTDTTYLVTLTATNALGCTQTLTQSVQVYPVPIASIAGNPLPQTWPAPVVFNNNSNSNNSTNYLWDLGNGTVYQGFSPDTVYFATWNTYNVLMIANNGQCSDTAYLTVPIIAPDPVAGFIGDTSGCAPLIVAFQDTSLYTNGWLWEFGDGGASINTSPVHTFDTPGTYTVRQIVIGYNGEMDSTSHVASVVVFPRAEAIFTVTPSQVTIPQQPVYIVNLSENSNQYLWDFGDGDTSSVLNPQHIYTEVGLYDITLMVNNEFNCPDTLTQFGAVNAVGGGSIEFPNAFSPLTTGPNDGRIDVNSYDNDLFFPKFEGIKNYELTIYDKWGEVLFHSTDIYTGWNGYYKGEICQQDVYIWKSNGYFQNGQSFELSGNVTLVRK
jgi:PKD repeat protein